ncbi:MAG: serine/threonine-protein kinase [Paludisphaera borealis]|uniref:serine/threonine-protein kinase n=1 Tax=Paludisphaera borealis TaxID=1387353 RepID=UPI002844A858|nr:serine/threonine-protein kinase [Paludisphaera borealis]MDR3621282.1 serine/threonine-protein kinase [Paludisphaera borealis]
MRIDACPTDEILTAFLLGDLPDSEIDAVREHQEACSLCESRARLLDDQTDFVVDELRRAALVFPSRPMTRSDSPGRSHVPPPRSGDAIPAIGESPPVLPDYDVDEKPVGIGSTGVVYKARHRKLGRVVALKMIAGRAGDVSKLLQIEAKAVAHLQHPNIVQIFEIGEHGGHPFLALELVEGGSLDQRIEGGPRPPRLAADLVRTLASAVDYAHRQGIIHCDLKPSNILVTHEGVPKITDFGIAKWIESDAYWGEGVEMRGTPRYMAPEQADGAVGELGPATDVYSLGVILYEMVAGRVPHLAKTAAETLKLVREQEPDPPSRWRPGVPRDLDVIALKCLRKAPSQRYSDAKALADDLGRFLGGEPIHGRPVGSVERAYHWAKRRPALLAAPILAGLSLVAFNLQVPRHQTSPHPSDLVPKEVGPSVLLPIIQSDGSIRLGAAAASLSGSSLAFEHSFGNLGFWHTSDNRAAWTFRVHEETRFRLVLEYANENGAAGNAYEVRVGDAVFNGQALATQNWASYQKFPVGELTLPEGVHRLEIRCIPPLKGALFDLRAVILDHP